MQRESIEAQRVNVGDVLIFEPRTVEQTVVRITEDGSTIILHLSSPTDGDSAAERRRYAHVTRVTHPTVGMGATLCFPSDRYGHVIRRVGKDETWFEMTEVDFWALPKNVRDLAEQHDRGGFGHFSHTFTPGELADADLWRRTRRAYLRKDGRYYEHGTVVRIGKAVYHRDYSD